MTGTAAFKPRRPTNFLLRAVEFRNDISTQVEELLGTNGVHFSKISEFLMFIVKNVLDIKAGPGKLHDILSDFNKTVYFEYLATPYIGMEHNMF